ncbi:transcriptional regulator [Bradyrhizobium sp. CCBAU 51745]|uniref:transcriptional activator RfaH n=1 Tax=Bradyrhizobium sp. CCBAU 51745 TaxID=1325099 RepID=UPI00230597A6|nr:transcriptional activator RfaH [Bradyrhizobium sp. CCBAU 51745]MDA9437539.1 transcriptional regulator [Bradyrhizobium sp. CCBAU 51745]
MRTSSYRWHVVQTQVHAEGKAAANLKQQGYEVYMPRYLRQRRHARRVEVVPAPLFPRYLFVGFDAASARWRSIQSTYGVSHLVCHNQEPAVLPDSVIDELRAREDDKGIVRFHQAPQYARGDKIRVIGGALGESLGLFEGMADRDRVAVLLDLLGRKVRVILDRELVAAH